MYKTIIFLAFVLIIAYAPIFFNEGLMNFFVKEDMLYETLSPIYLLVAAVMFGIAFRRSSAKFGIKEPGFLKRLMFLGFVGLFFVAAMEEISWGQRFFHFSTPEIISEENTQHEFTLHNLKFLSGKNGIIPIDFDQLTSLFALALGFFIPVLCALIRPVRQFLNLWFPVLPVQFGLLFAANYALQKLALHIFSPLPEFYHNTTKKLPATIHEIREHNYALLLMVSAIFFIILELDRVERAKKAVAVEAE